jgi:phage terminase large subunit GpA-like protein
MYYLFERQENVIVGIPDINMAGDKWADDIRPAIAKSSYAHLLPKTGPGSKGAGKLQKITFEHGKFLRFMSAGGNDKQRAGATSRVLIVTETDGLDVVAESSQEGQTKIAQLEGRVRAHEDAVKFFECTVSTEDAYTWKNYLAGTQSRIMHPCRGCGCWVSPEREHLIGWEDAQDEIEAAELGRFSCPECGILYSEDDRLQMNLQARLVHKGQEITPEGEIVGSPPRTLTLGFRWSAFQNLLSSTAKLSKEEWQAKRSEDPELADIERRQQVWALPAVNPNIEKVPLDVDIVRGTHEGYKGRCNGIPRGSVPNGSDIVTAFIDISRRFLQWKVEAKVDHHIHVIDYGFHETESPDIIGEELAIADAIVELTKQLEARFPLLDLGLVDCGNWRQTVISTLANLPDLWRPSHGLADREHYRHPSDSTRDKIIPSDGCRLWYWSLDDSGGWVVNFNADAMKHRVHGGFQIRPQTETGVYARGCVTLFGNRPGDHTEYAKQITAEEFVREFVKGKGFVAKWHKHRKANHMFDGAVGNAVARLIVNNWRFDEAMQREAEEHRAPQQALTSPDGRPFFVGNR